jgi:peptidoglycan L-alanyl-D-glutamate endopeptidase CwlK
MADNALSDLYPIFQLLAQSWLDRCKAANLTVRITVTWRGQQEQDAAKASGLSNASFGTSPHNVMSDGKPCALAFDYAAFKGGAYVTDGSDPIYAQANQIARDLGMDCGADWTVEKDGVGPDFDHIQMRDWKSVAGSLQTNS